MSILDYSIHPASHAPHLCEASSGGRSLPGLCISPSNRHPIYCNRGILSMGMAYFGFSCRACQFLGGRGCARQDCKL